MPEVERRVLVVVAREVPAAIAGATATSAARIAATSTTGARINGETLGTDRNDNDNPFSFVRLRG